MARLTAGSPLLDSQKVLDFFEQRAQSATRDENYAVTVFTDVASAEARHKEECALVLPLLGLPAKSARVFDVGCGGGRWARSLLGDTANPVSFYCGIDFSPALISLAQQQDLGPSAVFRVARVDEMSRMADLEEGTFTHILAVAVSIYLNDDAVSGLIGDAFDLLPGGGMFYMREGITTDEERLTLIDEPSQALGTTYNAVYRTLAEYTDMIQRAGFTIDATASLTSPHFKKHTSTEHRFFICRKP